VRADVQTQGRALRELSANAIYEHSRTSRIELESQLSHVRLGALQELLGLATDLAFERAYGSEGALKIGKCLDVPSATLQNAKTRGA
jgi:hypothetical protein